MFSAFRAEFTRGLNETGIEILQTASMVTYGAPLETLFFHLPNSFFLFLIFLLFLLLGASRNGARWLGRT
jgi:hypothetical protein